MNNTKVINIDEIRKRREEKKDPAMKAWLQGVLAGYDLKGDCDLYEYFIRGLHLGFDTARQDRKE